VKKSWEPSHTKPTLNVPLVIVTAACNRIEFYQKLDIHYDLVLEGSVTWVGKSSIVCGII
jgi:hypothetical protein